jgi:hypothetical protein
MSDLREHLHAWLRDAHAMEEQAITMLTGPIGAARKLSGIQSPDAQWLDEHAAAFTRKLLTAKR